MDYEQLLNSISVLLDKKLDERLKPISVLLDKKLDERLKPITEKLNIMELKQDRTAKKLEDLRLDVAVSERDIRKDIHELKDEMETVIEILRIHDMIPN